MIKNIFCLVVVLLFGGNVFLLPGDTVLPLPNSSFEALNAQGFPGYWVIAGKENEPGKQVIVDNRKAYTGGNSLQVIHQDWGRTTVVSAPIALKVGELYRLSGRLKTESVLTWPGDRYPTSVPACLTMESFPLTNHSPSLGVTSDWKKVDTLFIATRSLDRVRLHLGYNGNAKGTAWFDDICIEKVEDISGYIPLATVRWCGPAFRYTDRGWIFVHIEGAPYARGYQYGYLLADEIAVFISKLAAWGDKDKPRESWDRARQVADAFMLRKYDEEYLLEMKGIADGAAAAGAAFDNRPPDLLDIVTINSSIDIDALGNALRNTPHALSGKNFLAAEEELQIPYENHKCSGLLANGPATKNGDLVFAQLFMWNGYTAVHWNVLCDVIPEKGNRLVYQTFPGGIHSGSDFYLNAAGIIISETSVDQTPFDMEGIPQSNRIRRAAQYSSCIDDVVRIMSWKNNGLYTNDWMIGDAKTNEIAIFLLGTKKSKLWRSTSGEFPGNTPGFYWSDNKSKDDEVRKEYIANADNAPYDLVYAPWSPDILFNRFFKENNGKFDEILATKILAAPLITRPHSCDCKITTREMARNMVFLAHWGKSTLREKFPQKNNIFMDDKPGAIPHFSLGYSVISPVFVSEKLKILKANLKENKKTGSGSTLPPDFSAVKDIYGYSPRQLWFNTVYPASDKENWFISSTAAYWEILKKLPADTEEAVTYLSNKLTMLNNRLLYVISREGAIEPLAARQIYDANNHYQVPRMRGTFLLHQLRLYLGDEMFSQLMNTVHRRFKEKPITNRQLITLWEKTAGKPLEPFIMQWINRKSLPAFTIRAELQPTPQGWQVNLTVKQTAETYHFFTTVVIETGKEKKWEIIEVKEAESSFSFFSPGKPTGIQVNAGNDIPVPRKKIYSFTNYFDDFDHTIFVYGTSRQIEANHTLTLRFREMLGDFFTETLPPVKKDSEVTEEELTDYDLFILGGIEDNELMRRMAGELRLILGKNHFQWLDNTYGDPDDGLVVVFPNPYNSRRVVYLVIANSVLQLYRMTKEYQSIPAWALFKGDVVVSKGYHPTGDLQLELAP